MRDILLFVVLLTALMIGWWLGRRGSTKRGRRIEQQGTVTLSRDYFVGLNFLLTEQPDRAIETFVQALEVNSETIDTHITLGNLFRSRGEADRAVKIHQNLLARPALSSRQSDQVQLELARDFMRLGVLDRAEGLLDSLIKRCHDEQILNAARRLLIELFEQEKEWQAALDVASTQRLRDDPPLQRAAANWLCELALEEFERGHIASGQKKLKQALSTCPSSVRSHWIQAERFHALGRYRDEIKALSKIPQQDREFSPIILERLGRSYDMLDDEPGLLAHLDRALEQTPSISALLMRAQRGLPREGLEATAKKLSERLERFPNLRGVVYLAALDVERIDPQHQAERLLMQTLHHHLERLVQRDPRFVCRHCGFQIERLYWHCPQCHAWETIKPIDEFPPRSEAPHAAH